MFHAVVGSFIVQTCGEDEKYLGTLPVFDEIRLVWERCSIISRGALKLALGV